MRAVMDGWRSAMATDWRMEFLTAHRGPDVGDRVVFRFAGESLRLRRGIYTPSEFPNVLMYVVMGLIGLRRLVRQRPAFTVILPQDGVYSAAFAGIIAKLAGIRLVAVDHGNVRDTFDPTYYVEKRELITQRRGLGRALAEARLAAYMRVLRRLARFGTRRTDHFLVASDDIAHTYQQRLGVPTHRITRFPFMIDGARYAPADDETRMRLRADLNLPADAIIVVIISRLHPVKGIDTGITAAERAYDALPEHLRKRMFLLIAGDGSLREQVAEQVRASRLADQSHLWGEASADDVAMLLKVSDIFLYPARRGINSMAILEAMGAGCATVATITSPHIAEYLAEDRGIAVAVEDVDALAAGLAALIADDAHRQAVGLRARDYVMQYHTATAVRRYLLRATYWVPSLPESAAATAPRVARVTSSGGDSAQ
jgi:glycosyltransferase involved in cell wall biosynthesis